MKLPALKINFTDFWPSLNKQDNFFWNLLSTHYQLELSDEPDVLFFSVFGEAYNKYKCLRIFYTGELYEPKLYNADLSISFSLTADERNYRFPLHAFYFDVRRLLDKPDADIIAAQKQKFCCFVVSNKSCKIRNQFFRELSKYKQVDSGGKYLNNIGGPVKDKMGFISAYKFVISFENKSYPGYTTEKIVEPMLVNSIPIYWGDPLVGKDFNTKSFVSLHDFASMKEAVQRVIQLDNDESLYRSMLQQHWLPGNQVNENYLRETLLKKMVSLIDNRNNTPLAAHSNETKLASMVDAVKRKIRGERKYR